MIRNPLTRTTLLALLAALGGPLAAQTIENVGVAAATRAEAIHPRWQGFEPMFQAHPCPFPNTTLGARTVSCGYVLVPEDRTDPASRLISLTVARANAPGNANPAHAVVFLNGGPGGATVEDLGTGGGSFARGAPVPDGDLVVFDQRGTGDSEARLCRGVASRDVATGVAGAERKYRDDLNRCFVEALDRGITVDAYSTWHNAHDVRDLRRALGYEQWNLWGLSYGTRLARAVMDVDPAGVRAAVLDSAAPAILPASVAQGLRSSLDAIDRACAGHARCRADVGSFAERFVNVIATYEADPLVLEPEEPPHSELAPEEKADSELTPEEEADPGLVIDGELVASSLRALLYRAEVYQDLPVLLRTLENRDREALRAYARLALSRSNPSLSFGTGMALVTSCRWLVPDTATLDRWRSAEPVLSRMVISRLYEDNLRERCQHAYRIAPDASVTEHESGIPALVLSGLADPVTPPAYASAVLASLANAQLLEFPYVGHAVLLTLDRYAPGCGAGILAQFVSDTGRAVDASCAQAVGAPDFLMRVRETQGLIGLLTRVRDGTPPIAPALAVGVLLFALFAFPLAAAGRRIDTRRAADLGIDGRGEEGLRVNSHRDEGLHRARLMSWTGAALAVAAGIVAASAVWITIAEHPLVLALGVLPWIGWAGWLGLAGALVAWGGAVDYARRRRRTLKRIGTEVGLAATAVASAVLFVFLSSSGAAPV